MLHFLLHAFLFHIGDIFGFLYKHRKPHLCHRERSSSSTSVYSSSVIIVALFLNVRLKKNMQAHYRPPLDWSTTICVYFTVEADCRALKALLQALRHSGLVGCCIRVIKSLNTRQFCRRSVLSLKHSVQGPLNTSHAHRMEDEFPREV